MHEAAVTTYVRMYVRTYVRQQINYVHTRTAALRALSEVKLTGLPTEKDDVEDVFLISTAGRKHKQPKIGTHGPSGIES